MALHRVAVASLTLVALLLTAAPSRADLDKYLPPDTEAVVALNVRQVLDAAAVAKHLDDARDLLKAVPEVFDVLADLGFDPFKDLDRVIAAGPSGGDADRGLIIVHGRFDPLRFKARAAKAAEEEGDTLKIHKVPGGADGQFLVYEVAPPGLEPPLFVAVADKTTLLASPGKDYVVEALKRVDSKKQPVLKNKDFEALLSRLDDKQSLSAAAVGAVFQGADLKSLPVVGELLEKVTAVGGGATLGDGLKFEFTVSLATADDARALRKAISDGVNSLSLLGLFASDDDGLAKVMDVVKSIKVVAKGKTVTLKAQVDAETIDALFSSDEE